jgi:hypothetical protein
LVTCRRLLIGLFGRKKIINPGKIAGNFDRPICQSAGYQPAQRRLKAGGSQDWLPHDAAA